MFIKPSVVPTYDKKARKHAYYLAHKEEILEKTRIWALNNKEKVKKAKNKWRANNKERTNFLTRRYIYRRKNAKGFMSLEEQRETYKAFPICPYCNKNKSDTLDHVVPLSRGGSNDASNIVAVCRSCNSRKSDKTLNEFLPILSMMWGRMNRHNA